MTLSFFLITVDFHKFLFFLTFISCSSCWIFLRRLLTSLVWHNLVTFSQLDKILHIIRQDDPKKCVHVLELSVGTSNPYWLTYQTLPCNTGARTPWHLTKTISNLICLFSLKAYQYCCILSSFCCLCCQSWLVNNTLVLVIPKLSEC